MNKAKILIIAYYWPPLNAIGSLRPYWWAKILIEAGHEVTVLTAKKSELDGPQTMPMPGIDGLKVIEVPYIDKKIGSIIAVAFNGVKSLIPNFLRNYISQSGSDPRKNWYARASKLLAALALQNDVVLSSYSPAECHLLACDVKKHNPNIKWIADYRDLWSQSHSTLLRENKRQHLRNLELATVAAQADLATTVSGPLAEKLKRLIKIPVHVVMNGFDDEFIEFLSTTPKLKDQASVFLISYTGSNTDPIRSPRVIAEALADMFDKGILPIGSVKLEFYGRPDKIVNEIVTNKKFRQFSMYKGFVSRAEAIEVQRKSNLLCLMGSCAPSQIGVVTGKIFEYIASNTPILSIGSDLGTDVYRILNTTKTGYCSSDNIDDIKDVILSVYNKNHFVWFNPNKTEILKYSRSTQSKNIITILDSITENVTVRNIED